MSDINIDLQSRDTPIDTADTNKEYIQPSVAKKQPPVLKSVAHSIIVETVKDFFRSIIGFFLRYIKHFIRCFQYFWSPSLKRKPFDKLDFKENSQHAFEFMIIIMALLIFLSKLEWIPESSPELKNIYSNDLTQKFTEILLFIIFAAMYLLLAVIGMYTGRIFRKLFKIDITLHESDILFVYLNNAFFSITAVIALILRSSASLQTHDEESIGIVLLLFTLPSVMAGIVLWSFRFAMLHKMKFLKGTLFFITASLIYGVFYILACYLLSALVLGV